MPKGIIGKRREKAERKKENRRGEAPPTFCLRRKN
jgi:hypothetical protein